MEEEDYIHSTQLPALTHFCCSSSFFLSYSLHTLTFSHSHLLSQNHASFIGKYGELLQHICQHGGDNKAIEHATNCGTNVASTKLSGGVLPQNNNILTKCTLTITKLIQLHQPTPCLLSLRLG